MIFGVIMDGNSGIFSLVTAIAKKRIEGVYHR
ncbi:MAG: hypothetical protein RLZZ490_1321 [Cyanobacteriota bacterium]